MFQYLGQRTVITYGSIEYERYIDDLSQKKEVFEVVEPSDFDSQITVSKLRKWIQQKKLDMVAIDGITYLSDERYKRGDTKTVSLTNISEDLMQLSKEMHVPILVVVQANRTGVVSQGSDEAPELESIRDSDGISHNASKVLSMHQKDKGILVIIVKKQRIGPVGGKLTYSWSINTGEFSFIPTFDDAESHEVTAQKVEDVKRKFKDKTDIF